MSSKDSSASFNMAVKHLFRHLHDARVLRKNSIVRRFFEDPAVGGLGRVRERTVLEKIQRLVRQGADHCRDADLIAGNDERALRQHAIVIRQCLEQHSMEEVAAQLGLSRGHLYRERAEICRRVARYISDYNGAPALDYLPELDEFRLLMDRTKRLATFGDANLAFKECDELVEIAPSALQKIEALRASVLISIHFGAVERAERASAQAQQLYDEHLTGAPSNDQAVAQACVDHARAELAGWQADNLQVLRMMQRAALRIEPIQASASARVRELYVEILHDLGTAFWNLGNVEKGYECAVSAEANLTHVRAASPQLRARTIVELWKLRNYLLTNLKSWYPLADRLKGLAAGFEQAYVSGAVVEAMVALIALTECHAFSGNDSEALRCGRLAVMISGQQPSERIRQQAAIEVALALLGTGCWEDGCSLLPSAENLDVYHRDLLSYFPAARAFRLGRFGDAWALASNASDQRYHPFLSVRKRLVAAACAYELNRRSEAHRLIEAAVPVAEQLGSAPILRDAYDVAAKITGDPRFRRQAGEIGRLLTA